MERKDDRLNQYLRCIETNTLPQRHRWGCHGRQAAGAILNQGSRELFRILANWRIAGMLQTIYTLDQQLLTKLLGIALALQKSEMAQVFGPQLFRTSTQPSRALSWTTGAAGAHRYANKVVHLWLHSICQITIWCSIFVAKIYSGLLLATIL